VAGDKQLIQNNHSNRTKLTDTYQSHLIPVSTALLNYCEVKKQSRGYFMSSPNIEAIQPIDLIWHIKQFYKITKTNSQSEGQHAAMLLQ
jgi:hypothetical protein